MLWLILLAFLIAIPFLLLGLYRWASKDPGVEREVAHRQFQEIQDLRGLRRSGYGDSASIPEGTRLKEHR